MKNLIYFLLFSVLLYADTGMWMPHQVNSLNLKNQGLELDPNDLLRPDGTGLMNAIVKLGGATGEFVSDQGLILTNHHVAFGAIQRGSDTEHDYIKNGFLAEAQNAEIEAKGMYAEVLLEYTDVSDIIHNRLNKESSFQDQYTALDKVKKELVADAEQNGTDLRAYVKSMYSGNQYYLFVFKRIQDIRIVYAPPRSLGNFGGDIDNWMWPRHTCDFTFLRAYVSPSGEGKPYSQENVPFQPKSFLKISTTGFSENDLSFVMGYPGKTFRNYTSQELILDIERMQDAVTEFQDIIAFIEKAGANNREIEIKYANKHKGFNNALKNYTGKLEGFAKANLIAKKQQAEQEFINAAFENMQKNMQHLNAFLLKEAGEQKLERQLDHLVSSYYSSTILSRAYTVYRIVQERAKPDIERESAFQERTMNDHINWLRLAERGYDLNTDKAFLKFRLQKLKNLDKAFIPKALQDVLSTKNIDDYVEGLFAGTIISDAEKCIELLNYSPKQLEALDDPMLNLAGNLEAQLAQIRESQKSNSMEKLALKRAYLHALLAYKENSLAPDANSSLRLTFGHIAGYAPRDAVYYAPQTTLSGVIAKKQDEYPFALPDGLEELYKTRDFGIYADSKLDDVPACFLNTTNVTGGNSGSPTLNARGEQIGIIFDMTYESVIGDYYIIPEWQRTISVDIRYVLFIVDKLAGAQWIIDELTLVN